MTRVAKLILIPLLAALALAQFADAVPLPGATGAFGIAPARRYVVATPSTSLTSTIVTNTTASNYRVSVFPVLLAQNLTGAFDFSSAPRDLSAAKLVLSVGPTGFALGSGQQQEVALRWNLLPQGRRWVAPGVVFQGVPQGQRSPLHVITRLLSVNFLRLPGPVTVDGMFTGLFPQQFGPRGLRFIARVKNTGDDFTAPSDGRLVIRDSSGTTVFTEPWKGIQILPGASVDFPIDVRKILQAGDYTVTVTMRFGGKRSRSAAFRLMGPNQLPTPSIAIRGFNASGLIGSRANVTARIISDGTAPAGLTLHLFLGTTASPNAIATGQVSYTNLAPGTRVRLSRPLGGPLRRGPYRVIATWTDQIGAHHSLEADFTALPGQSLLGAVWSVLRILLIALLALALLIAAAYAARRIHQRQRQTEAELAAARAQLRMERIHERAAETGQRLRTRNAATASDGEGDGESPAVLKPEPERWRPPERAEPNAAEPAAGQPEVPPAAVTGNGSTGSEEEHVAGSAPVSPASAPAAASDWVPPWERERCDRTEETTAE